MTYNVFGRTLNLAQLNPGIATLMNKITDGSIKQRVSQRC